MWSICNTAGREGMAGTMQAVNIVATLAALDGSEEDLDKVLAIEAIAEQYREKKGEKEESEE